MSDISEDTVRRLLADQFPQWAHLPVEQVIPGGWDNRTFRLGAELVVRMPSDAAHAPQVLKEHRWLPKLASSLPLEIPEPVALGEPDDRNPWNWSVNRWIEGDAVSETPIERDERFAIGLAEFLRALWSIDPTNGPKPGADNFHRGGPLVVDDAEVRDSLSQLGCQLDATRVLEIWNSGLRTVWERAPLWVHGDISADNLLVRDGRLAAVIDFGGLCVGDPACDLAIAWTYFDEIARDTFRKTLDIDIQTWARGQCWSLWKALITIAATGPVGGMSSREAWRTVERVLNDSS